MIPKHLTGKEKNWPLHAAGAAAAMSMFASQHYQVFFHPLNCFFFVKKLPDKLNLAYLPLEQFYNTLKDYL